MFGVDPGKQFFDGFELETLNPCALYVTAGNGTQASKKKISPHLPPSNVYPGDGVAAEAG